MGMFDDIECRVPLPDNFKGELQTKDFECRMVCHLIDENGHLWLERIDGSESVPKAERPYPDAPEGSLESLIGSVRTHRSRHRFLYTGVVNFYGSSRVDDAYEWHEYNATFKDGTLVGIEMT